MHTHEPVPNPTAGNKSNTTTAANESPNRPAENQSLPWWKLGPIYQIYPRSFLDTNGDGVGDLEGIRRKLDYLHDLGVRGLWLSPIYPSPLFDFGYDITNYHDIDPVFGSLDLFRTLINEADQRGISIIIDMVLNHTSHLHPWFVESRSSRDNPKRDWYIWKDGRRNLWNLPGIQGPLGRRYPNNWMAAFGGHAWTWDRATGQYYLHLFTEEQPDLNWRNPEVQKAMLQELRFWLDLGVKGFRLDVINYLIKDARFRNNPYRFRMTYPRRHDLQHHQYDRNQPETYELIGAIRDLMDSYGGSTGDTMLVGEVYPDEGVHAPDLAATYIGDGSELLHLAFDFSTMYMQLTAADLYNTLNNWYSVLAPTAWPCHVLSNHDQSRAVSRLCAGPDREAQKRLLVALLLTQRGTHFLYYGEEIGMVDGKIRRQDLQDPLGKKYYPFHPGRDRSRTPMQWTGDAGAGFTTGKPWLPINPDYKERNVEAQMKNPDSLLSWYRSLIELRKKEPALQTGSIEFLKSCIDDEVLAYRRVAGDAQVLVVLNVSARSRENPFRQGGTVLCSSHRKPESPIGGDTRLAPWEATIYKPIQ